MTQQPYSPTAASQPAAPGYAGQHDTTALPRVPAGYSGSDPGYPPGPGYTPGYAPINHEAAVWQEKFARQRTRTRIAVAFAALASVAALGLGVATWQLATSSLFGSTSDLAASLGSGDLNLEDLLPGDGAAPEGTGPEGTPNDSAPGGDVPLADLPLPESLKSLAGAMGITDVGQLLDLAVANGMMSQAEADQVRAAIAAGAVVASTR